MKTHTQNYKNQLKSLGKEIDSIITIGNTELTSEQINSVSLHYEGNILKSVMKQLDLVLTEPLEKGTELNYKFGLDVNGTNEYLDYGQFIVKEVEKQEDTNTYKITCYDKMLYSMIDYEDLNLTYPITIKNYLQAICTKLGLTLKDDTFANQDNEIENELYLDSEGNSLGYTFRDVLDEIAQATGSTICINDNDELEVRYIDEAINETQEVEGTDLNLTDTEEARLRNVSLKGDTKQGILPSEYQQVEYIESTGTQYIDTGFKSNSYTRVVLDYLDKGTTTAFIFGARYDWATDSYVHLCMSAYKYRCDYGSNQPQMDKENNVRYVVDKNKNITTLYKNGSQVGQTTSPTQTFNANINMYLFALNNMNVANSNMAYIQLYSCQVYDNGTLVRDYIPCYRIRDNVIGLYDIVGNQFYTNKGTGTFTKGANLPTPDYPQSIDVVSGLQEVDIVGKNILHLNNGTFSNNGITAVVNNGTITLNGSTTNSNSFITIPLTDTYTIKANQPYRVSVYNTTTIGSSSSWAGFRLNYADGTVIKDVRFDTLNNNAGGTLSSDITRNQIQIRTGYNLTYNNFVITPQLELGSVSTNYEEYTKKDYDINLGKNIFDTTYELAEQYNASGGTSNGYTITNNIISITKSNGSYGRVFFNKLTLPAGTYTLQYMPTLSGSYKYVRYSVRDMINLEDIVVAHNVGISDGTRVIETFTLNENKTLAISLQPQSDTAGTLSLTNIQLEKGSQATSYSEYFTPIELCKIGTYQDKIFKGSGKNISQHLGGWINNQGVFKTSTDDSFYFPVVQGETYIYNMSGNRTICAIFENIPSNNDTCINGTYVNGFSRNTPFVASATGYMVIYANTPSSQAVINDFIAVKGNTIGTYEPYGAKDKWLLHKEIGKVVLNGSENWLLYGTGTPNYFYYCYKQMTPNAVGGISNYYKYIEIGSGNTNQGIYGITNYVRVRYGTEDTIANYKSWLNTHNIIFYYILANPTTEEITNSELISQLKELDKAKTYEGTTNITSSFPLSLTYVSDIEEIDEELIKNTRASFDNVYSPINSLVLSRSADSDNIYIQDEASIEENGLHELKIADNQILNGNNRDEYINEIFDKVNGLTYSYNDFESIGITYLELCDRYKVKVRDNTYKCVMFNDEIEVNNGLNEIIYTDEAEESKTDYTKADKTDRRINQTYIIADKQQGQITALVNKTNNIDTEQKNNYQSLLAQLGNYATTSDVEAIQTEVEQIQTDSYTRTEIKQILKGTFYDEDNNQVVSEVVKTISGTFDENGMTYAKTNAKTSTTINESGVRVNNATSNQELLFAGYDDEINQTIVRADNMTTRNFLVVGEYSRFQDYEDGTGVFDL